MSTFSLAQQRARGLAMQRIGAWSGPLFILLMVTGFVLIGGMIPPPAPGNSASETARFFLGHADRIRLGMIISAFSAGLLVPFSAVIALQMRRIEGKTPLLSMVQFGCGVLLSLEFIYLIFFWQTAVFRVDRSPEIIQLLNDMAWIPYIGLSCTVVMQAGALGWACLKDHRLDPVFPRWFGYYQIWAALLFMPGTFNVYFHTGPLAWNGLIAFYLPIVVYASWIVVTPLAVFRAIRHQEAEEETLADQPEPDLATLAAEVTRLRHEVASLGAATRTY